MIKYSFVEGLITKLFDLEPDRPMYYFFVVRLGKSIFMNTGMEESLQKLNSLIFNLIEKPFRVNFNVLVQEYYNPRFLMFRKAYTRVGDTIDGQIVTRMDIAERLEKIKDFVYDEVMEVIPYVRFSKPQNINFV